MNSFFNDNNPNIVEHESGDYIPIPLRDNLVFQPTSEDGKKLINAIRWIAMEQPGRIVTHCQYINRSTGDPECIVGQALHRLGWLSPETNPEEWYFDESYETTIPKFNESQILYCLDGERIRKSPEEKIELTNEEARWVREAQRYQDGKNPWYNAPQTADRYMAVEFPHLTVDAKDYTA